MPTAAAVVIWGAFLFSLVTMTLYLTIPRPLMRLFLDPSEPNLPAIVEMGVLLLLFTIGMELSLKTFKQIYKVALTCAVLQSSAAMLLAYGIGALLGWDTSRIVLIGFVLSLSSTAVGIPNIHAARITGPDA